MTKDTKSSILALLVGLAVGGVLFGLELAGVDWSGIYRKWFDFTFWTLALFGCVAYVYAESLDEKWRYKAAFFAALALHSLALILYLRTVDRFPNLFFLFLFFVVEAGVIGGIFGLLGAKPYRARRRKISLRETPPSRTPPTKGP